MSGPTSPRGGQVSYRQQYRRCGKAGCSRCTPGAPGHGPYWYAFWREGGRVHSRYLGKQAPAAVAGPATATHATVLSAPAQTTTAPLRVRTLGRFAVWRGGTELGPEQWRSRRAASLFKCLLSAPGQRLLREQAIELLWPEAVPEAGAANLRTAVHLLRQILDGPGAPLSYLRTEGPVIALAPTGTAAPAEDWLDATAFARAAQAALAAADPVACRAALALYGGEYLSDDRYAAWAEPVRTALHQQYVGLLVHLATLSGARGDLDEAEECLRRVLASEPGHEEAAATLMRLLAESGRRGEALRVYQTLATTLEQELEVAPSAEVAALRARLVTQEAAPHAAARPPTPDRPERPTNLPRALTSFVGRQWEIQAVTEALATARLVTLTGPGGCGKTRLALAVAERLVETATDTDTYPDGVWLVELAALADPALLPQTVAATLGVAEQAGQPLRETLAAFLRPRRMLLVLDNCEHLIAACAALATHLLQGCPRLCLLATSRERLAVAGEQTYLVPSLAAPDPAHLPPLERLGAYEAVTLFLERARARRPELALSAAAAAAVAQICARLDGLPLALELAAARVGILAVETIAARLDDRFRLLTGGPCTALPRQQTLQATLDWSYALLGASEQRVLNRLAVFAGGWTVEAAQAVCGGGAGATQTVLDVLTGLVHRSLVHVVQAQAMDRYRLLETVQQYALECLAASGEAEELHRLHSRYYLALAAAAEPHVGGSEQLVWLERLEQEHDNLRAALRWALDAGDSDGVVQGAITLAPFWRKRGYLTEGRTWLEAALAASVTIRPSARAQTLLALGQVAEWQGDGHRATEALSASLDRFRALGDKRGLAAALLALGKHLGNALDPPAASPLLEESVVLFGEVGDRRGLLRALRALANNDSGAGDDERATRLLTESARLARELGQAEELAVTLSDRGLHSLRQRRYREAESFLQAALPLLVDLGDTFHVLDCLEFLAAALGCQQAGERAATLFAAVAAARTQMGAPLPPILRVLRDQCCEAARARTDAVTWTTAWEQGESLPLERAVREAVGIMRQP